MLSFTNLGHRGPTWAPRRAHARRCIVSSAGASPSVFVLDLSSVVDVSSVSAHAAWRAARALWPGRISNDHDFFATKSKAILCSVNDMADAVFLVRILQDELIDGKSDRARGARRTRPFRLAEIGELWSEPEGVGVCVMRWALEHGIGREELRTVARTHFDTALSNMAAEVEAGRRSSSSSSSSGSTDMSSSESSQYTDDSSVLPPAAAWLGKVQAYRTVREAVTAVLDKHCIALVSTLPPALTTHMLSSQGILYALGSAPVRQLQAQPTPNSLAPAPKASSNASFTAPALEPTPVTSTSADQVQAAASGVQGPGLVVVHAARWADGVHGLLQLMDGCGERTPAGSRTQVQLDPGSSHPATDPGCDLDDENQELDRLLANNRTGGASPLDLGSGGPTPFSTADTRRSAGSSGLGRGVNPSAATATSVSTVTRTLTVPQPSRTTPIGSSTRGAGTSALPTSSPAGPQPATIISCNLARLEELAACNSSTSQAGGTWPSPPPAMRLGEWGPASMALRARALCTPGVDLLDEAGLAELLGCTDSRAVMDGIAWTA